MEAVEHPVAGVDYPSTFQALDEWFRERTWVGGDRVGMTMRIDTGIARKAVAHLRAQGLSAEAVLARAGLDAATLGRKGTRITFAAHVALLEHAAVAARDPCFGLHLGAAIRPRDLGLVGYLSANAASLGDVLGVAAKICPCSPRGPGPRSRWQTSGCGSRSISSTPPEPAADRSQTWARLWSASPYGRYLDHGSWLEAGLTGSICRSVPAGEVLLPGICTSAAGCS